SSSGLGHRPFTAATRVRLPYGTPNNLKEPGRYEPFPDVQERQGTAGVTSTFRIPSSLRSAPANQHQHLSTAQRNPDKPCALSQCRDSEQRRARCQGAPADTKGIAHPSLDGRESSETQPRLLRPCRVSDKPDRA